MARALARPGTCLVATISRESTLGLAFESMYGETVSG